MEAKDTRIMYSENKQSIEIYIDALIAEQAEISFKAGQEERDKEWNEWKEKYLPTLIHNSRKEVVGWVNKYKELAEHGDYSNGVEVFGLDEGRVRAHELMDEYEKGWQTFKNERGIE